MDTLFQLQKLNNKLILKTVSASARGRWFSWIFATVLIALLLALLSSYANSGNSPDTPFFDTSPRLTVPNDSDGALHTT